MLAPARCRCSSAPESATVVIYEYLLQPFADFGFMRRALVACLALSVSGSAIGVFLILRRRA